MSLASIIRLEFAYPGVGILAGDSLQYLSIATAHGVIMVFFMIMPSVFGAFGNFLLPTQLGVHDVAFPRLNSAAFWFLPGGLIMLMQLVCVDRRYQRMNCFNIRELQGTLKRKFFTDLVNSNDHREFLNQSMVGLRFKSNNSLAINSDMINFYNFGTTNTPKAKNQSFMNAYRTGYATFYNPLNNFSYAPTFVLSAIYEATQAYLGNLFQIITSLNLCSILSIPGSILVSLTTTSHNLNLLPRSTNSITHFKTPTNFSTDIHFNSENLTNSSSQDLALNSMSESSASYRFNRFSNALISYDYKCGHYLGIWDQLYPSLMTSYIEVARGIRKAPWFYSDQFTELLTTNHQNFIKKFTTQSNLKLADVDN
jgi:hypothetical protein